MRSIKVYEVTESMEELLFGGVHPGHMLDLTKNSEITVSFSNDKTSCRLSNPAKFFYIKKGEMTVDDLWREAAELDDTTMDFRLYKFIREKFIELKRVIPHLAVKIGINVIRHGRAAYDNLIENPNMYQFYTEDEAFTRSNKFTTKFNSIE